MEMTREQMIEKFSKKKDILGLYWRNGRNVGKNEIIGRLKDNINGIKDTEARIFLLRFLQEELDKVEQELNVLSADIDEVNAQTNNQT